MTGLVVVAGPVDGAKGIWRKFGFGFESFDLDDIMMQLAGDLVVHTTTK